MANIMTLGIATKTITTLTSVSGTIMKTDTTAVLEREKKK